jgi:23S rRNA G2445 N2-methylase RlmL
LDALGKKQTQKPQNILFKKLLGFDNDASEISMARENAKLLLKFNISSEEIKKFKFEVADVFAANKVTQNKESETTVGDISDELSVVICNPPYGSRIKIKESKEEYFQNLVNSIAQNYKPARFGVIVPASARNPKAPISFKETESFGFLNNGIRVKFLIFQGA